MPSSSQDSTGSTRPDEIPPIVLEPLIHRTRPEMNVPEPSVTTSDSASSNTTSAPLTNPASAAATTAAATAQPTGHPCWTLSTATTIAESVSTEATERS